MEHFRWRHWIEEITNIIMIKLSLLPFSHLPLNIIIASQARDKSISCIILVLVSCSLLLKFKLFHLSTTHWVVSNIYLLQRLLSHTEKQGNTSRSKLFDLFNIVLVHTVVEAWRCTKISQHGLLLLSHEPCCVSAAWLPATWGPPGEVLHSSSSSVLLK